MKKRQVKKVLPILAGAIIVSGAASLLPSGFLASANVGQKVEQAKYIGLESAKEIALKKVSSENAKVIKVEESFGDEEPEYEIKVRIEEKDTIRDYDIEIDAISGEITDFDLDVKRSSVKVVDSNSQNENLESNAKQGFISKEKAIEIAMAKVNDSSARLEDFDNELDESIPHYDIEIETNSKEYEIEIDGRSGKIIKLEVDSRDGDDKKVEVKKAPVSKKAPVVKEAPKAKAPVVKNTYISRQEAINIALKRIGKSATLDEIDFEKSDNPPKYEIEMFDGNYEYEIDVHAITGAILDYERDED